MNHDKLHEAKQRLRIPELWRMLGLPGEPGQSCRSPLREDHNPSFSVFNDGQLWKDHATGERGDAIEFLARARSLSNGDACREFLKLASVPTVAPTTPAKPRVVATYDYRDETGALLFQVVRFEPKTFRQRKPDATSPDGWTWKLDGVRRVLYHLPEILTAIQREETIIVAEGEKDVAALVAHGFAATCNPGGAGKWLDEYTNSLRGAEVVIVADKDEPGRNHARLVAGKLHGNAKAVRIVELPDFNGITVKDAHDYFAAGAKADDFLAVVGTTLPFAPPPDLHTAPPKNVSNRVTLREEPDEPEVAPFPIECIPPDIALMIRAVANAHRVPDSLPGLMALALVAASIGKGLVLDWRPGKGATPANLFIVPTAESGSGKSECFKLLSAVFLAFERDMQERWRTQVMPQLQADLRFHETQLKKLDRKLGKDSTSADEAERFRGEMKYHLAQVDELKGKLHEPQVSIQDATVEKAATVMHWNDETALSVSSDARKLVDNLLGRYSANKKIADDAIYLNAFSGDDVKVDRQGREGIRLANPCMTLLWALQPDALDMLLDEDSLQQGGFLARCLIAHTHAAPQHIGGDVQCISQDTRTRWESLVRKLLLTYRQPPTMPVTETVNEEI